jgi:N-acyl amino acid synthase of PEP-CTERM/exosortase system
MSILDAFNTYFEMIPANSDGLKQEVYKLRHQVYCVEHDFLEPSTEGFEYDEYDAYSCHYLIQHKETKRYMATTRLILPSSKNPEKLFPVEAHSKIDNFELLETVPRANLAELSRFCVSKDFRRRAGEQGLVITNDMDSSRYLARGKNSSASITLALFACAIKMSSEHNIQCWIASIEPALKRVVKPLGINIDEIGPLVDYHGMRFPCTISVDKLLQGVGEKNPEYLEMLTGKNTSTL